MKQKFVKKMLVVIVLALIGLIIDIKQSFADVMITDNGCQLLRGECVENDTSGRSVVGVCIGGSFANTNGRYKCVVQKLSDTTACSSKGGTCTSVNTLSNGCPSGKDMFGVCDDTSGSLSVCCGTIAHQASASSGDPGASCASPNECLPSSDPASKGRSSTGSCSFQKNGANVSGNCYGPANTGDPGAVNPKSAGDPGSASNTGSPSSTSFENPLQYNTVQEVLGSLLSYLQGIIVLFSLIFIVIGAVLYITSAGNDGQMKTAKGAITASMIGLAIGIAAPTFLKEISVILGWNNAPSDVSGASSLSTILTNVLTFLTGIVGILALIMLVIGALMYLSAAGDEKRIDEGKKIVKFSIIGIIIAFSALVIVKQIAAFFVG